MSVTFSAMDIETFNSTSIAQQASYIDGRYIVHPMLDGLKAGEEEVDGGDTYTFPVEFDDHSEPTELVTGYEPPNMVTQTTLDQYFQYTWWFAIYPIVISHVEQIKNSGPHKLIDLQKQRVENVQGASMRKMDQQITRMGVAQHTRLNGFNGIDYSAGFLEAAAPAAQTHSVGGLSKSTYASYPLLLNQYYNFAGSMNSNGFDGLASVDSYIRTAAPDTAGDPAFWLTSNLCYAASQRLANARVITNGADDSQKIGPYKKIMIAGVEVAVSPWMPIAGATSAITKGSMYRINPKQQKLTWIKGGHWELLGWREHPTQPTLNNFLFCGAQVMPKRLSDAALLVNGEAY